MATDNSNADAARVLAAHWLVFEFHANKLGLSLVPGAELLERFGQSANDWIEDPEDQFLINDLGDGKILGFFRGEALNFVAFDEEAETLVKILLREAGGA